MPKVTVEMNDDLDERVESVIDELKEEIQDYFENNAPGASLPGIYEVTGDNLHELVDGAVPAYSKQLDDLYYLHSYELDKALDDAGLDTDSDNRIGCAIYCYIEQEVHKWFSDNINELFEEFEATGRNTFKIGDEAVFIHPGSDEEIRVTIDGFMTDDKGDHFALVSCTKFTGSDYVLIENLRELTLAEFIKDE